MRRSVGEYKGLKQKLSQAHASERASAKEDIDRFLDIVPQRLPVADEVWARHDYGYSGTQTQAVFSTGIMVFSLVMILAGRWQDRVGPRTVALTGGLVLAAGYSIAALAGPGFPAVLLGVGVIGGAGIGLGYVCPIAACVKWFPDLKGLVTGLAVAGFGGGAFFFIRLAGNWGGLLAADGVSGTLLTYAAIFAVLVSAGGRAAAQSAAGLAARGLAGVGDKPGGDRTGSRFRAVRDDSHTGVLDAVAGVYVRLGLRVDGDRLAEGFWHSRGATVGCRS